MTRLVNEPAQAVAELAIAMSDGDRLSRGRRYQKGGKVSGVHVMPGTATASVDGSRAEPYEVTIAVRVANENVRQAVAAGDVRAAVPGPGEIALTCVCPDWGDPCKHGVAALLEFAREIDDDPSMLLRWRGVDDVAIPPPPGTESLFPDHGQAPALTSIDGDRKSVDALVEPVPEPANHPSSSASVSSFDPDEPDEISSFGRRKKQKPERHLSAVPDELERIGSRLDAVKRLREVMGDELADADALAPNTGPLAAVEEPPVRPDYPDELVEFFTGAMPDDGAMPVKRLDEIVAEPFRKVRIMLETHDAAPVIADAMESISEHWLGR